jgi:hypothetical protein
MNMTPQSTNLTSIASRFRGAPLEDEIIESLGHAEFILDPSGCLTLLDPDFAEFGHGYWHPFFQGPGV